MERRSTFDQISDFVIARFGLFKKAGSFAVVGAFNTLVDFAVFATAIKIFGFPLVLANVLSWSIAVSCSYVINSYTTFAAESGRQLRLRTYGVFVLSGLAGLIVNTTALLLFSLVLPVLWAKVAAIGVSFLVNFSLSHFVVFGGARPSGEARDEH